MVFQGKSLGSDSPGAEHDENNIYCYYSNKDHTRIHAALFTSFYFKFYFTFT